MLNAQVTADDYLESLRLDERDRPLTKQGTLLLLIIALIMLGLRTRRFLAGDGPVLGVVLFGSAAVYLFVLIVVRSRFLVPRRARQIFKQQKSLHEPFEFEVVADGLRFDSVLGTGVLPWSQIYRWRETPNLIIIEHSDALRNILPKRAFASPEALGDFKATLFNRVGPENRARSTVSDDSGATGE